MGDPSSIGDTRTHRCEGYPKLPGPRRGADGNVAISCPVGGPVSPLVRNVLSTYAVRFATVASGVVLFPVIAHQIGLTRYGLWLLVSGTIGIFFVADLGIGTATLRQVADRHAQGDREGLERVVSTSLAFFAVLGVGLTGVYL